MYYQPSSRCGRVRTESVLLLFPSYCTTLVPACQEDFKKKTQIFFSFVLLRSSTLHFQLFLRIHFFKSARTTTRPATFFQIHCLFCQILWEISDFFLFCIVLHEKFDKKSSILNIAFFEISRYNIKAVGGTNSTASRTTVTSFLRSIKLMISTRKHVFGCAFFNRSGDRPCGLRELLPNREGALFCDRTPHPPLTRSPFPHWGRFFIC